MPKNKGFSLAEILVALVVIGVITASAMPLMTKMAQNKTGVDRNTIICITESPADWYKATDGTTELPAEGTKCWAAVVDTQHNRGRALETAKWYANNGADSLKITAKKLLRTACDNGGKGACDYFIDGCWKSGKDISPYCDDEENFLDLTYYLHQYTDVTLGGIYVRDRLENLLTKNITNLVNEVTYACSNDQKPDHDPDLQNLGDNIACELLGLNIAWWIKQCNSGNAFACEYCYDKQYNRSCHEIKSVWEGAETGDYQLTANGDPGEPDKEPTIKVYCDMTNLASAAISGCGYGAAPPHVSGDCEAGHDYDYNRSCVQVKTEWGAAPTGNFELTYNGAGSPVTVYCNTSTIASAAITGCGYNTDTEGPIPPDEYVPGDCAYGRTEYCNRDCNEILSAWPEMIEGYYYNLTAGGDSPPSPGSTVCPPAAGTGEVYVWGWNNQGQLGLGDTTHRYEPTQITAQTGFSSMSGGWNHTCGLKNDGTAWCWGLNGHGRLGVGDTTQRTEPTQITAQTGFSSIEAANAHTCGLKPDGTAWCWGFNGHGALGLGDTTYRYEPTQITAQTGFTSISAKGMHTCGLKDDGTAWCWGYNAYGQLGLGSNSNRIEPTQITAQTGFTSVSAGWDYTCGLKNDGTAWCWGYNNYGQLGLGDNTNRTEPTQITAQTGFTSISAGGLHTCGLKNDGTAWCWGHNSCGQLGPGDTTHRTVPTQITAEAGFTSIEAGGYHTCGLKADGTAWCWGKGGNGQLGLGDGTNRNEPAQITAQTGFTSIDTGYYNTFGLK